MNGEFIAFFIIALCTIGGAVFMISLNKVVHMVVALAFTFISIAGLYVLLNAEFVAVVQILIYSGAISILMLFGIMMTKHDATEAIIQGGRHSVLTAIGCIGLLAFLLISVQSVDWSGSTTNLTVKNTEQIGLLLYSKYIIPFELVSVLLLVALVGAIVLSKKEAE